MDLKTFMEIYNDESSNDLEKMKHKYGKKTVELYLSNLKSSFFEPIDLQDARGNPLLLIPGKVQVSAHGLKLLHTQGPSGDAFGLKAMEDETASTFDIEGIDYKRESVRKIFAGYAPADKMEERIAGMKKGIEFISNPEHSINEQNLFHLYKLAISDSLEPKDKLLPGHFYRHDTVMVTDGMRTIHTGISHDKLPSYMKAFIAYINADDKDELRKAAIIHFYLSYLHPYFDGNGRMSRLLQMWYLVQRGCPGTMHVSLSTYIEASRKKYYRAFEQVEKNAKMSGVTDITPFLTYMNEWVYEKLPSAFPYQQSVESFSRLLEQGDVTEKERDLWQFVLSAYGTSEFSTKQLEKDFGDAAYATIRAFVIKFEEKGILVKQRYGNRNKYRVHVGG